MSEAFDAFVKAGWRDHGDDPEGVARRLAEGIALVELPGQGASLAGLITHVLGEHLERWDEGIQRLDELRARGPGGDSETALAIARSVAALALASGREDADTALSAPSDRVRALAIAAAARRRTPSVARNLFTRATDAHVQTALAPGDPATRALAITANNLASSLEEKRDRSAEETELMLFAAEEARRFWEQAGGWLEIERAEYRLAMSCLQAGLAERAREHARRCLEIVAEYGAPALEVFFGNEALARAEEALGESATSEGAATAARAAFAALGADDQNWCQIIADRLPKQSR